MSRPFRWVLIGLQTTLFCASVAMCQDPTGVVEGQVTDPSAALIPNAAVTVTNEATGFSTTQQTSGIGRFRFSYLPVGNYKLHVSAKGFSDFDATDIHVDVNRVVNLPLSLTLAGSK